jgi:hypothetical protein
MIYHKALFRHFTMYFILIINYMVHLSSCWTNQIDYLLQCLLYVKQTNTNIDCSANAATFKLVIINCNIFINIIYIVNFLYVKQTITCFTL